MGAMIYPNFEPSQALHGCWFVFANSFTAALLPRMFGAPANSANRFAPTTSSVVDDRSSFVEAVALTNCV